MSDDVERRVFAAVRLHARQGVLPADALAVGLDRDEFARLCGVVAEREASDAPAVDNAISRPPLLSPLIALMWDHRSGDAPWTRLMAGTIASAAFGARHLWQDLGAAGRPEVSGLMQRHFPELFARNVRNLKWKHHLFNCLGERLDMPGLRPPRCDGCDEQKICFPDGPAVVTFRSTHGDSPAQEGSTA